MSVVSKVEAFLKKYCPTSAPLLLAFSGGADSLCLFHCLLEYQKKKPFSFHIAHVDHGWRSESEKEAEELKILAEKHQIPFHLKKLNCCLLKGNLEAACRQERYLFFGELSRIYPFQGVLVGHHQNDQVETIIKRILEGSHWSHWSCLRAETWLEGIRVLRPLLSTPKEEILEFLQKRNLKPFDDPTNHQLRYTRARLRHSLLPKLQEEFGKNVHRNLHEIGEETAELTHYFETKLNSLFDHLVSSPWGSYLDFEGRLPDTLLEMRFFIRLLSARLNCFFSREIIHQAAEALMSGQANKQFKMGKYQLGLDRYHLFCIPSLRSSVQEIKVLEPGSYPFGEWSAELLEESGSSNGGSWKEAWKSGELQCFLPKNEYFIGYLDQLPQTIINIKLIKQKWRQAKIPAFLYDRFPVIWNHSIIQHEFLTGKAHPILKEGFNGWKLKLRAIKREVLVENE